mmetsp:Transcript_28358/g.32615  ORF Transcript_28358/g.32615 Transcript_28358/m.32615 type:complete len:213 (-) Transcript_28358:698-1336(-)
MPSSTKNMKNINSLFLITAILGCTSFGSATKFTVKDVTCSGGVFSKSSLKASCSGDCDGGDTLTVSGTVTASTSFNDEKVTLQPCILGVYCPNDYQQEVGSICDWIDIDDDGDCGSAGKYSLYQEVEIPNEASDYQFSKWGFMVRVKVLIGGSESCSQDATAYEMSFASLGAVSLIAAGVFWRRKKLAVLTSEEGSATTNFVEFRDMTGVVV